MRDSYLDEDVESAARRFAASGEFDAVLKAIAQSATGSPGGWTVLDLGAGTGVASFAFARAGAARVIALEPDPSAVVGQLAIRRCCGALSQVSTVSGFGEALPFADRVFDVVYARQVLHHARDLARLVAECARVLRPGGVFVATREHVVDDEEQLAEFLRSHPVHQLAGGEHAWRLSDYEEAIRGAGLRVVESLGPWDSLINAFPLVRSDDELRGYARDMLARKLGMLGRLAGRVPVIEAMVWSRIDRPSPGRLHTFVCVRPQEEPGGGKPR